MEDIIVRTEDEAKAVFSRMGAIKDRYGMVTVADLKDLVGLPTVHLDQNVGWYDLHLARAVRTVDGTFLLHLPAPEKRREVSMQQMVEKGGEALASSVIGRALKLRDVEARAIAEIVLRAQVD